MVHATGALDVVGVAGVVDAGRQTSHPVSQYPLVGRRSSPPGLQHWRPARFSRWSRYCTDWMPPESVAVPHGNGNVDAHACRTAFSAAVVEAKSSPATGEVNTMLGGRLISPQRTVEASVTVIDTDRVDADSHGVVAAPFICDRPTSR